MSSTTLTAAPAHLTRGTYTDHDGIDHVVLVDKHNDAWTVFDTTADLSDIRQIERLLHDDEMLTAACGIADEYLHEMTRFLNGERAEFTVPHPAPNAMRLKFEDPTFMPRALRDLLSKKKPAKTSRRKAAPDGQASLELAA